ncbi:uncharacterized protein LOC132631582 isoform X3 [Lycium barbarum]|nr:uncharacterized protein LOC132631582 isoform X3 [Lycium barbarum]XP_060203168.1 uncharacterized protein LOC132631582 isoform X3 [Lycium barbarum]XP_060203169.1 uncharacterized protein LOC132631582 isoform X3 [Lycium barbarum]
MTVLAYANHYQLLELQQKMAQKLGIHVITTDTADWTCKIQVVDICGPGESNVKKIKYLNMIVQDEQEDQIKAIVYGDDIPIYQSLMKLYHTYWITGARIQLPNLKYESPLHAFEWVLDKKTIIDPIEKNAEDALPPPTKLNVTSFLDIKDQAFQDINNTLTKKEFNILAIIVNCSPPRYVASVDKRLQELIVIDTLYIIDNKVSTTIQIDPPYSQCQQLQEWVAQNKETLTSFTMRSTSRSGSLIFVLMNEVVPIANIQSQEDGKAFYIEAKISFPNSLRSFCVLNCSSCGQEVRSTTKRKIHCMNCNKQSMLVPRCRFDVNLKDASGSATGMIMDKEGKKLLSLTAAEIYERASAENDNLPVEDFQSKFDQKLFRIQVKKPFGRASSTSSSKLYIQSCIEKESIIHSLPAPTTASINISKNSKRKKEHVSSHDTKTNLPTEQGESVKMN